MRIGFVTPNFLPRVGGTQLAIYSIAKELKNRGNNVSIATLRLAGEDEHEIVDGMEVHRFDSFKTGFLRYPHTSLFFYNFLKRNLMDVDCVHQFHVLRLGLPTVMFSKKFRKPLITSLMGTDTFNPVKRIPKVIFPYLSFVMNRSDFVTSPSQNMANHAYLQGCHKNIIVVPHGTDTEKFKRDSPKSVNAFRVRFAAGPETMLLLSVQRLELIKRVDVLIYAAKELVDTYKIRNFRLLIIGDGNERGKLERLRDELGLKAYIEFLGLIPHDDLPKYYAVADIFVFHSTFEAFGLILAEAMAAGKPVVSAIAGAIPEVVENGCTGFVVEPNNPVEFAQAISRLLSNPDLMASMGEKGLARSKNYDWKVICDRYIELYKAVSDLK